ncbi:MAG TPA: hypothetical protein VGQ69_15395 [Gemmatimonadales bacterium]|nr:hypothetical protein [Gemmatimonadales bacterium]
MIRKLLLGVSLLLLTAAPAPAPLAARQTTEFARLVARLSEPGGYFDSDNLVSNETSYLHVLPALRSLPVRGGAYLGVGPEQNFSYLAEIRPALTILIDIRRDNMLLHLLFKAMFELSRNRMEYLCLLYGRPNPPILARWTDQPLEDILTFLDITPADTAVHARNHAELMDRVNRFGVALTDTDRVTLRRFHDEFATQGLELTFTSRGRASRPGYPSERQLYLATDLEGRPGSYLSSEERFRNVRELQRRDKVIPVVGDLSGPLALKAIGAYLRELGLPVSALYVSNVEMYLFRQGNFPKFVENVRALPARATSVLIRSYFGRGMMWSGGGGTSGFTLPQVLPGHLSAQQLQLFSSFLQLGAQPDSVSYLDVLTHGVIDLRVPPPPPPPPRSPRQRRRRRVRDGMA